MVGSGGGGAGWGERWGAGLQGQEERADPRVQSWGVGGVHRRGDGRGVHAAVA